MRFMCGHRLQGRTNSVTPSVSVAMLSAMEHSVTSSTRLGFFVFTKSIIAAVEPAKSLTSTTSGGHSGCAMIVIDGSSAR